MKTHEEMIERMKGANPVGDLEMITDGQLAELTVRLEEERRAAAEMPGRRPARGRADDSATPIHRLRPRWLRPALAFAAACLLVLGTIGIVALVQPDGGDVADDPQPTTTTLAPAALATSAEVNQVYTIATAPDGSLWATTLGGLVHWVIATQTPTVHGADQGLPDDSIRRVVVADDGTVWVGDSGWLARFDGSWTTFSAPRDTDGPLTVGPNGSVWVAFGEYRLGRFDGTEWEYFQAPLSWDDNTVGGPWADSLALDAAGTVWVGALGFDAAAVGLLSFDGEAWTHVTPDVALRYEVGASVAAAPDGTVWIASSTHADVGGGVVRFDGSTWTSYTTADGLPSDNVDVVVGRNGAVWAVGTAGVSFFDGSEWRHYPDVVHEDPGAAVDGDGMLWMPVPEDAGGGILGFDGTDTVRLTVPVETTATTAPIVVADPNPLPGDGVRDVAPFTGTCPPGTDPDAPGPVGQDRPASDWVGVGAAAFDLSIGRVLYVDALGETWTFDVCTNIWHRMNPTGAMLGDLSGGLVYDVDSEVTVALGFGSISVYDAATNAWTQRDTSMLSDGPDRITPFGGVYDPETGLIITTSVRGEDGSAANPTRLEAWSYDVDTNVWTNLGPLWVRGEEEEPLVWSDLLGYSPEIDRFIFASADNRTALLDLRTGERTVIETPTPAVSFGWPKAQYGQAAGTPFVARGVDAVDNYWDQVFEDQICGFDPQTQAWTECFAMPGGSKYAAYGAMVGDPVNNRLVLIHGTYGNWWVESDNAVWAIDLDNGETTELLSQSE